MKFEQLLQIYWSRGFLYGGKVRSFNLTLNELFYDLPGLSKKSKFLFIKRFEFNYFYRKKTKSLLGLHLDQRRIINMYLSQIISINSSISELVKYNVVRLYLIKSFRGRAQAVGKPSRGQRTWSNAWNAYKCNKVLRLFISDVKKNNVVKKAPKKINFQKVQKKIKKAPVRLKMQVVKKKKANLWF